VHTGASAVRLSVVAVVVGLVAVATPVQAAAAAPFRPGQIVVVAGLGAPGYSGDGGPARDARIVAGQVAVGPDGSVYLSDQERVRRVTPDGVINTVLVARADPDRGNRETITAVAVGPDGTLFVTVEVDDARQLRRIDPSGAATVLAGESELGTGDDVAVDGAGNAYLYDATNKRVVRVDPAGGVTAVGEAPLDFAGARLAVDGGGTVFLTEDDEHSGPRSGGSMYALGATGPLRAVAHTSERLPTGPAVAPDGTVYFIDQGRRQIMRVGADRAAVPVSPVLDGLLRGDLAVGPDGDLYFTYVESLTDDNQILRLVQHGGPTPAEPVAAARSAWADDAPGTVHTVAGSGVRPPSAKDTRPAWEERGLGRIAVGGDGTVYVTDPARNQVRAVAPDGTVRRFAGTGTAGDTDGDHTGVAADGVVLNQPFGIATGSDDSVYVTANGRLYRVAPDGTINTVDTGARTGKSALDAPRLVATDAEGAVYFADYQSIRKIDSTGVPVLVVGYATDTGDTTPAHQVLVHDLRWFAIDADGSVYFIQGDGDAVEVVRPDGTLGTVTGGPTAGFAGDGGPAAQGALNNPSGVAVGPDGARYLADTYNNRVRRVDGRGVISTVAGTGQRADTGDGGPATEAALTDPTGVAVGKDGTCYVLTATDLVRAVDPVGMIRTVADLDPAPARRAADVPFAGLDSFAVGAEGTIYLASTTGIYSTRPDGELRPVGLDPSLRTFAKYGPTSPPGGAPLAAGPDGSLYLVPNAALRAYPDGSVVTLLGGGVSNRMVDQPPENWSSPTEYTFREGDPADIAVAPDGTLYLSTTHGLYSRGQDGTLTLVLKAGEHDLFGGIALAPDGTPHLVKLLDGVYRVVGGKTEPVARNGYGQEQQEPKFDVTFEDPTDVAFASDGVMFVSAGREIRRFSPNGDIATVYRSDDSSVTQLAVGPGDDLYFLQPDTEQVRVLVKAAKAPGQSNAGSWRPSAPGPVVIGAVILLLSAGLVVIGVRRRRQSVVP